jgi:hydroxypyruvate isomerase
MKELTIIGNMKLIFYNNLTKSYIYEQNLPNNLRFLQQYNHKYERRISLLNDNEINYNIFDKNSVFLKIASGTYTLDRTFEEDNVTEKYDIFRVQKYGGSLIKFIGKSHPVL